MIQIQQLQTNKVEKRAVEEQLIQDESPYAPLLAKLINNEGRKTPASGTL